MEIHVNRYFLCSLVVVLTLCGCTARRPMSVSPDSQYIEQRAAELYEKAPAQALELIDSAEQTGAIADFRAELLRARLFTWSTGNQRQFMALQIGETLLSHDSVKHHPRRQQEVLELLVNASRMRHDDELLLRWSMQYAKLLRGLGKESEALRAEADIGMAMTHLGQQAEGMAKIDNAIKQLKSHSNFNAILSYILACKRKITVLRETGHHEEILPVAQLIQDRLTEMEEHPDDFIDGTEHAPTTLEQLQDYCDFYGAQALAFKAAAYAEMDDGMKARRELALFGKTDYGHTLDGRKMIAPTLGRLGDYPAMLAIYRAAEAEMKGDTLRHDFADILLSRAEAAEAQGYTVASLGYRKRYEALLQILNDRQHRNQSHDYAALYHAQEQQMEIERQQAIIGRKNLIMAMSAIIMLLACAFAFYFFRQKRFVDYKNHVLVEQMSEAIDYKQKYEEAMQSAKGYSQKYEETLQAMTGETVEETESTVKAAEPDLNAMTDEELFQYMSGVILSEQLHLKPVCDRQTITSRFGLSEKRVGAAFAKGSNFKSLASFVRDSRLEHAAQLLRQHPEMTIGEVAAASGFASHTRFTADFKTRYSVSPTEFRSMTK